MRANIVSLFLVVLGASSLIANSPEANVRSDAHNPVISHIPRDRVVSDVIASAGYSKRRHILEIEFINGAIYRYLNVPASVCHDLLQAQSKARYYIAKVKGNYPSVRVRPRVKDEAD